VESANVVAELPGREKPDEIVLIGCHLDSWDVGTGAMDDGAGCAIVMETLAILSRLDPAPRRTVRAVLFTNEEFGAHGARAYVKEHSGEMERHVLAIEADMGGGLPLGFGVSAGEGGLEIVRETARDIPGGLAILEGGGGADISSLRPHGVPLMGLHQESKRYFDYHHSPADTLDKIDRGELEQSLAVMAAMTWLLAEREEPLPRIPAD
jgi:Zn-dependent M28 family amino/carboxypeptidase